MLKRGKPEERSQIVHKLAGHVVELSQHKFASNVIEKCLEYGDSSARGVLIEEIVGLGDNSDNLLVSNLFYINGRRKCENGEVFCQVLQE